MARLFGPLVATGGGLRAGGRARAGGWRPGNARKVVGVVVDARTVRGGPENAGCDGWQWAWSSAAVMGEEEDG